jgi:hypothetical protein
VPQFGTTPLYAASQTGSLGVVEALLAKGADVQAETIVGIARLRPLSIVLTYAHAECAWLPLGDVPVCGYISCCPSRRRCGCKA